VTDGEFRRFSFLDQMVGEIDGIAPIAGAPVHFQNATEDWIWHNPFTVTGKISAKRQMTLEEFAYNRARATKRIKVTFPSPLILYTAWSPELSTAAYKDAFELFADAAAIIKDEVTRLAELGCTYVQIDAPDIGTLVDPENRGMRESLGMPTERTLTEGIEIVNSVADVPGVTFGLHLCKGNNQSMWIGTGGYDVIAEAVFTGLSNFDVFLLEYDDERSGGFEPLTKVPDDKAVVLGLISSKTTEIEPVEQITARVHEAANFIDLERLGVSTQCGFASVSVGANHIGEDTQQRKLELVGQVARAVW